MVNFRGFCHSDLSARGSTGVTPCLWDNSFQGASPPPHVEEESNRIAWRSELLTELRYDVPILRNGHSSPRVQ